MDTILKKRKLVSLLLPQLISPATASKRVQSMNAQSFLMKKWFLRTVENIAGEQPEYHETNACERHTYFEFKPSGVLKLAIFGIDSNGNCVLTNMKKVRYLLNRADNQIVITADQKVERIAIEKLTKESFTVLIDETRKFHFGLQPNL